MYGRSLGSVIDSLADRFPDEPALVDGDLRLSFTEVVGEIRAVGQALRGLGLNPGDRVGVAMNDSTDLVVAVHAAFWAGLTVVPLNMKLSPENHGFMLSDAGVEVLMCHSETAVHAERAAELAQFARVLSVGPGAEDLPRLSTEPLDRTARCPEDVDPEAPVWVQYTGGTTGLPKGVVHSHRTALSTLIGCALEFDLRPGERHAHVAPLTHGGFATLLPVWLRGGCNVLVRRFDPARLLRIIEAERITSTLMVPTMISRLLEEPGLASSDVSSLRTLIYGAAPIPPRTLRRAIDAFGPILLQCYGQTECFSQISVLTKADHVEALRDPDLLASCGRPVAIADVRIGDPDGRALPDGEVGEVLVRGPHVFAGYLNRPTETRQALAGDWLHTGDLGRRTPTGYLHLVDRTKDMIISGGFNVYPKEIEDVVDEHPQVRAVCVVGLPDQEWGERVAAAVVIEPGAEQAAVAADIAEMVRRRKGTIYVPKSIGFLDQIPLTTVGKHDKRAVLRAIAAGQETESGHRHLPGRAQREGLVY